VANKHKERMFLLHGSCLSLFCLCWYQSWFADVDAVEKGVVGWGGGNRGTTVRAARFDLSRMLFVQNAHNKTWMDTSQLMVPI